jgi:hypothetical protein
MSVESGGLSIPRTIAATSAARESRLFGSERSRRIIANPSIAMR